jgi:hypothetical protein
MPLTGYTSENFKALHYSCAEGSYFSNSLHPCQVFVHLSTRASTPTQQKFLSFLKRYGCKVSCDASSPCNGVLIDCASINQTGINLTAQSEIGRVGVVIPSTKILWWPQWYTLLLVCVWPNVQGQATNLTFTLRKKMWQRQAIRLLNVTIMH